MFTPRELAAAYKQFEEGGPQHLDAETGISVAAYGLTSACSSFIRV